MNKLLNGLNKYGSFIVIALSLLAYFAYNVLSFEGSLERTINDPQTYIHTFFVIYLNQVALTSAFSSASNVGIGCEEYKTAETINNQIIKEYNNSKKQFRRYVKQINKEELEAIRDNYLFQLGDKEVKDLTPEELKTYKNLKATVHNIFGFNLPLQYEMNKSGEINYDASIKKRSRIWKRISKIFSALMFAGMTLNMVFQLENVGNAFVSLLIILTGLSITFALEFFPEVNKYKNTIPKKVIAKHTLFEGFKEYITHNKIEEDLEEETTPTNQDQPIIQDKKDKSLTEELSHIDLNKPLGKEA